MAQHKELVGLQMLRGACAAAVVIDHASGMLESPKYGGFALGGGVLHYGAVGVDIFFVISAFIISIVVLRAPDGCPRMSAAAFFEKRFTRIVPLMWLAILSYVAMQKAFVHTPIEWAGYARALVLWPDGDLKPSVIWTLRQEFLFYALFCFSFFGPRMLRWTLLVWALSPVAYVATLGSWSATTAFIDRTPSILFSTTNIEFGAGLVVGLLYLRRPPRREVRLLLHPALAIPLLVAGAVLLCWALALTGQTLAITLTMGGVGALLVALSARVACPPGALTRLGKAMGDASYSIYLFHSHVLAVALALRVKLHLDAPGPMILAGVVLLSVLVSYAIYRWIERPLVRGAKRLFSRAGATPRQIEAGAAM